MPARWRPSPGPSPGSCRGPPDGRTRPGRQSATTVILTSSPRRRRGPGIGAIFDRVMRPRPSSLERSRRRDGHLYGGTQPTDISMINRRCYRPRLFRGLEQLSRRQSRVNGTNRIRDQGAEVVLDSGSHINAAVHLRRTERPQGARPGGRWNGLLCDSGGSRLTGDTRTCILSGVRQGSAVAWVVTDRRSHLSPQCATTRRTPAAARPAGPGPNGLEGDACGRTGCSGDPHPHRTGASRVLYVAKFAEAVYVLHAFEKRSRKTAKHDVDLAGQRYHELIRQRQLKGLRGG